MFEGLKEKAFSFFNKNEVEEIKQTINEKGNLKEKKIEDAKNLYYRKGLETYFESNNITDELRNNYDFISLINANTRLEYLSDEMKQYYETGYHHRFSPEEIDEFEDEHTHEQLKEIYIDFFVSQELARDNSKIYDHLMNLVNKQINKMVGSDIEKIDERFDDVKEFSTNEELQLEDGSIIKKGTSFTIEGFLSDVDVEDTLSCNGDIFSYKIHFKEREGNIYNRENGTGKGYYLGESKLVGIAQLQEEVEIRDKMFIKDGVDFFGRLEKDLNLDDGSFIKKDTEFVIDGFKDSFRDGKYEIHFAKEEGNIYHNEFGDQYYFTSKEINQFAKVEGHEHGIAFDNIGIGGEFRLSVKELNIVASTDYDQIKNTILFDTPGDNLSYLENHGVNLDDYLNQYLREVQENIEKDESFMSFGKYLDDDVSEQIIMEYDKANEPWMYSDVKSFKDNIYERISESINKFSQVGQDEIESFLQGNKLKEGVYVYYKDSPEEYRLISSIEELKEYIIDYMNEDDTFNEDVEHRWNNKDISEWCEGNDIQISKKNPYKGIGNQLEITTEQPEVLEDKSIYYYYDGQSKPIRLGTVSDIVSSAENQEEIDHFVLSDGFIQAFNFEKNEDKETFNKKMAEYCILKNPIANDFKKVNAHLGLEKNANISGFKTEKDIERSILMKQSIER